MAPVGAQRVLDQATRELERAHRGIGASGALRHREESRFGSVDADAPLREPIGGEHHGARPGEALASHREVRTQGLRCIGGGTQEDRGLEPAAAGLDLSFGPDRTFLLYNSRF